ASGWRRGPAPTRARRWRTGGRRSGGGKRASWSDLVGASVAGNVLPDRFQRVDADSREPGELELNLEGRRILLGRGDEPVGHGANLPASRIIFEPHQSLDELAVLHAPVPAGEG